MSMTARPQHFALLSSARSRRYRTSITRFDALIHLIDQIHGQPVHIEATLIRDFM